MGLNLDINIHGSLISGYYLKVFGPTEGSGIPHYAISISKGRGTGMINILPIEKVYFTFGLPARQSLPSFDVNRPLREQCYEDFKARYTLGLLPWVAALREEDGTVIHGPAKGNSVTDHA